MIAIIYGFAMVGFLLNSFYDCRKWSFKKKALKIYDQEYKKKDNSINDEPDEGEEFVLGYQYGKK